MGSNISGVKCVARPLVAERGTGLKNGLTSSLLSQISQMLLLLFDELAMEERSGRQTNLSFEVGFANVYGGS